MRMDRRILYFPAITLIALTLTLTVIMVISTYRNQNKEQEQMEKSLTFEAMALLRLFQQTVHNYASDITEETSQIQQLATAVAPNDDIVYIFLFDQTGRILAHNDPQQVGLQVHGDIPGPDEILKLRNDDATEHVLEIRRAFHPGTPVAANKHYIALGLKMTALEQVHKADRKHNMMMATILILLGSASLFFILVVQNFYLVQRTLDRMKSYIYYVIESMANGLISLDADGIVTTMNPVAAELIGVPEQRGGDVSFETLFPEYTEEIRNVLKNDSSILNREIVYQRPDGSLVPVSISATQVKDNHGDGIGAVLVLHDLREVKELQQRARRAEHLASIGRMAATVAHEIRNPLSSIRGFAQYFATMFKEDEEERSYAVAMMEESDRLNRVVSELLDYARPLELNIETTSIQSLFEDTIRLVGLEEESSNIQISQWIDPDLPPIRVDRDRLVQVLLNLTQNSIAAMPDGGKLILKASWFGELQTVRISVKDTGYGISEQDLPRLFDPFFTTKTRGTGLGLAIVRKIIDAHHGEVEVQSEEGKGTIVTVSLPQEMKMREHHA